MTIQIANNNPRISYTATGGQTAFPTSFAFFDEGDINVYINDVLKALNTDYTVSGGSGAAGTVTLITGATAGDIIVLTRDVELERTTDFPTSGPFQVASLNVELDKIIAMIADMEDFAGRGLRLSDSDTSAALVLANKDARKGTVLAFNTVTGAVEVGPTIADTQSIADIKADIALLADIQDGTTATDAITDLATIASDVTTAANNIAAIQGPRHRLLMPLQAPQKPLQALLLLLRVLVPQLLAQRLLRLLRQTLRQPRLTLKLPKLTQLQAPRHLQALLPRLLAPLRLLLLVLRRLLHQKLLLKQPRPMLKLLRPMQNLLKLTPPPRPLLLLGQLRRLQVQPLLLQARLLRRLVLLLLRLPVRLTQPHPRLTLQRLPLLLHHLLLLLLVPQHQHLLHKALLRVQEIALCRRMITLMIAILGQKHLIQLRITMVIPWLLAHYILILLTIA